MLFTQTLTQQLVASQAMMHFTGKAIETQLRLSQCLMMSALPGADAAPAPKAKAARTAKQPAAKKAAPKKAASAKTAKTKTASKPAVEDKPKATAQDQMRRRKARKAPSMPPELPGVK